MPDLSGYPAVDVAVGLAFMFFLLSTAVSAINEAVATALGWRAKTLEDGLASLFGDPKMKSQLRGWIGGARLAGERQPRDDGAAGQIRGLSQLPDDLAGAVLSQPVIRALVRDPSSPQRRRSRPSYLPPDVVSKALVETIVSGPPQEGGVGPSLWEKSDAEIFRMLETRLEGLPPGGARSALLRALGASNGTLEGFRRHIEGGFDNVMERASGWYKRRVQLMLAVIAAGIAIGLNVDTVHVASTLWKDQAVRSTAAAQATAAQQQPLTGQTGAPAPAHPSDVQAAADSIDDVKQLQLPVGRGAGHPTGIDSVPGWLITIFALGLGAPFWFDVLSRLARLRGSGVAQRPRSLSDTPGATSPPPPAPEGT
jgi:hypothetical protein